MSATNIFRRCCFIGEPARSADQLGVASQVLVAVLSAAAIGLCRPALGQESAKMKPVPYAATERLKKGETAASVEERLGKPSRRSAALCAPPTEGDECWVYAVSHQTWTRLLVRFRGNVVETWEWSHPGTGTSPKPLVAKRRGDCQFWEGGWPVTAGVWMPHYCGTYTVGTAKAWVFQWKQQFGASGDLAQCIAWRTQDTVPFSKLDADDVRRSHMWCKTN